MEKRQRKKPKPTQLWFMKYKKMTAGVAAGLAMAVALGWKNYDKIGKNPYANKSLYPVQTTIVEVIDGDTMLLANGRILRLLGVDAPNRGENGYQEAKDGLTGLVLEKKVWLEYDRYQDDKYGRILAWVWLNCGTNPQFAPFDYMRLSGNRSRIGLLENPQGCKNGKLVQEELAGTGLVKTEVYAERGELKYQNRIQIK